MNFVKTYSKLKVALVYDRVNKWGGAERVLLALHKMFPGAPLYTSVYEPKNAPWAKVFPRVVTSFLQKIPFAKTNHEFLAPLMPMAFESFDFSDFDLAISVTSEAAKGIKTNGKTVHICYCLTPTRYLWSGYNDYFKGMAFKAITKPIVTYLKYWDKIAAQRPDVVIAISTEVQKRIRKYYGRSSEVLFPPVSDTSLYKDISHKNKKTSYLVVSRLVGYKKVDLAIDVFNSLGYPLVIVGSGRDENRLKSKAKSNIKFAGKVSEKRLFEYYQNAKALIMPQEEDFGIVAVEAQGYGVPVIAYKKGGSVDTVIDEKTGTFFENHTPESLTQAVLRFEKMRFKADNLIHNAKRFTEAKFRQKFAKIVNTVLQTKKNATKRR